MKKYAITMNVVIIATGETPEEIVTRVQAAFNRANKELPANEVIDMKHDGKIDVEIFEGAVK